MVEWVDTKDLQVTLLVTAVTYSLNLDLLHFIIIHENFFISLCFKQIFNMSKKYTDVELAEAIRTSFSIAEVCRKVGLKPVGGNYKTIHNKIDKLNLDTSHFTGQG